MTPWLDLTQGIIAPSCRSLICLMLQQPVDVVDFLKPVQELTDHDLGSLVSIGASFVDFGREMVHQGILRSCL